MSALGFFRSIYADNRARRDPRNLARDAILYARNVALRPVEKRLVRRFRRDDLPIVFIVGAPRSGTTLLYQLAARFLEIGYVTNFVARYWMAPVAGAARQARRSAEERRRIPLESFLGRTEGEWAPHEFSWFFQHWLRFESDDEPPGDVLAARDWDGFRRELEGLAGFFGSPLVMKNLNFLDLNVGSFARYLPQSKFVWIERDESATAASILSSRMKRYGTDSAWWSVRPRGYQSWMDRSPGEQILLQMGAIREKLARSLSLVPSERVMTIRYEDLVQFPQRVVGEVAGHAGAGIVDPAGLSELRLAGTSER